MSRPLRVLLVEDSADDADLILIELRRAGFGLTWLRVSTRDALADALAASEWDVVLSDHVMPQFSSSAALEVLKEKHVDLPFILVSGKIGEEAAVAAMRAGARDYVPKDHLTRLGPAVQRELDEMEHRRELQRAEQARSQLAAIVDSSNDAIIGTDLRGLITSWNPAAEQVFGYRPEEVRGMPMGILLPHDRANTVSQVLHRIREGQAVEHYETVRVRKDGQTIHVSLTMSPIKDMGGKTTGTSTIIRDITERKLAEERLRRSEMQLAEAQHMAHLGSWEWDLASNSLTWSDELYRIYGFEPQELQVTFQVYLERVHPDHREAVQAIIDRAYQDHQPFTFEERIVRPDGSVRILDSRGRVIVDDAGEPVRMMGTCQDITERKHTEEALRESEEKYRSLIENIPDVVWWSDSRRNTTFISSTVEDVYGYTPQEIYQGGQPLWFGRIHPDDRERVNAAYALLFKKNQTFDLEYRIQRKDGEWIWLHDRAVTFFEKGGELYAYGVFRDITERKRAEEERERLLRELQEAFATIKSLRGLLPICAACKKIRDDRGYWNQLEAYISEHSEAQFTHGICPDCARRLYPGLYDKDGDPVQRRAAADAQARTLEEIQAAIRTLVQDHRSAAKLDRRKRDRISFILPAKIETRSREQLEALTEDISASGIRFLSPRDLRGQKVRLSLATRPDNTRQFLVNILWTKRFRDDLYDSGGTLLELLN